MSALNSIRSKAIPWTVCLFSLCLVGCKSGSWFKKKKDPYEVLVDKESSGDDRADALANLEEPIKKGGSDSDQEMVILRLNRSAKSEPNVPGRLAAIQAMARFKDPRVIAGLEDAYYNADEFGPESATVIRQQVLTALGEVGHPEGIKLLTRVVNAPRIDDDVSIQERQNRLDERMAAARSLKQFKTPEAAQALQQLLKTEKDVALRDCARESLQVVTGEKLPPDAPLLARIREQIRQKKTVVETQNPRPIRRTSARDR